MRLRIATWNLDHASSNKRNVAIPSQIAKIRSIDPDVLILTETCSGVDLSRVGYVGLTSSPNDYGKYYSAIWSKYPMTSLKTYDPITASCALVHLPDGDLLTYGTILTYKMDKGPDKKSRPWEEHHKEILRHEADWMAIQNQQPGIPLIVAGDFNQSRDGSNWYRSPEGVRLLDKALEDNDLMCVTEEDFGVAGKLKQDPQKGTCRHNIDHICLSKRSFHVLQVGAWDHFDEEVYFSDHNGVFVDVTCHG